MIFSKKTEEPPAWYKQYKKDSIPEHLNYPDCSVFELFKSTISEYSNNIAFEYFGKTQTYKTILKNIHTCAKSLKKMGVREDDKVTICMPNTPEGIIMFYAVNMIGAIASMVHPLSAEEEIKKCLKTTKSTTALVIDFNYSKFNKARKDTDLKNIIVCSVSESMPMLPTFVYWATRGRKTEGIPADNKNYTWSSFMKSGKDYTKNYISYRTGKDIAAILYSGGTTGKSKGVLLSNLTFNASALQYSEVIGVKKGDSFLGIMPIFHSFGLAVCTHYALYRGCKIHLIPQFSPKTFGKLIKKKKPSIVVGVPTLFEAFISNEELADTDLSFVKHAVSGGDSLSVSLKNRTEEFLKNHGADVSVTEGYGLTECAGACVATAKSLYKPGSIGIPFPDIYVKIFKPNSSKEMGPNEEGEICITGPTIMTGYLNEPKETKKALMKHKDGKLWLHTGDLGKMDEDGFLTFLLRIKRMIISKGYNVYPSVIEEVINSHPSVSSSTVVGVPDDYEQQKIKAVIVLKKGLTYNDEIEESIKKLCRKNIAKYALPSIYEFKDDMPRTLIGKIAYRILEGTEEE